MLKQIYLLDNINMKEPRLLAIDIAFTNSRKVDLATLDSTLPHISVYQLREFLYPRSKNVRVKSDEGMCYHCIFNAKLRRSRGNL